MKPLLRIFLIAILFLQAKGRVVAVLGGIDTKKEKIEKVRNVKGKFDKASDSLRANIIRQVRSVEKNGLWDHDTCKIVVVYSSQKGGIYEFSGATYYFIYNGFFLGEGGKKIPLKELLAELLSKK